MSTDILEELGFYALAGQPSSSRDIIEEVIEGEHLGLGTAFISERYDRKEAATSAGWASCRCRKQADQDPKRPRITNHNTRHPMVTAGFARTMQSLTGGRLHSRLGRGIPLAQDAYGIPRVTTAQMEDFAHFDAPPLQG